MQGTALAQGPTLSFTLRPPATTAMDSIADNASGGQRNLIVGSGPNNVVRIFSGTTGLLLATLVPGGGGPPFGSGFGQSVATVGDQDADGQEDILIGAPFSNATGQAFLFSGSSAAGFPLLGVLSPDPANIPLTPLSNQMAYGWSVSRLDDLNNTGKQEFAIGAPRWETTIAGGTAQRVGIVEIRTTDPQFSPPAGPPALKTLFGSFALEEFGYSITTLRKLGGLSTLTPANFAIGSPSPQDFSFYPSDDRGAVQVFSGAILSLTQAAALIQKITPPGGHYDMGWCLASTDANADNQDDVLMGEPNFAQLSTVHTARVQFGFGFTTGQSMAFSASLAEGWSVSECGSFDANPGDDLLVGAPNMFGVPLPVVGHAFIMGGTSGALIHDIVSPNSEASFGMVVSEIDTSIGRFAVAAPNSNRVYIYN
jgi:hypothetical protein